MERLEGNCDRPMELPPGFRFHPTDEELITHYLKKKVVDCNFSAVAIAEVDMNKVEPWELPRRAKMGEKEWYFFCVRDRKYPTGHRTNRATTAGYWKATGKDKEIFRGKTLVGMKKTLVFYTGRAPKGEKSNWVAHEYRLEGKLPIEKSDKNDWVISRVFQKTVSGQAKAGLGLGPTQGHVHCFSNVRVGPERIKGDLTGCFANPDSFALDSFSRVIGCSDMDSEILTRCFGENTDQELRQKPGIGTLPWNGEVGKKLFGGLSGPQDFDCIWSY